MTGAQSVRKEPYIVRNQLRAFRRAQDFAGEQLPSGSVHEHQAHGHQTLRHLQRRWQFAVRLILLNRRPRFLACQNQQSRHWRVLRSEAMRSASHLTFSSRALEEKAPPGARSARYMRGAGRCLQNANRDRRLAWLAGFPRVSHGQGWCRRRTVVISRGGDRSPAPQVMADGHAP